LIYSSFIVVGDGGLAGPTGGIAVKTNTFGVLLYIELS
jgi:hypothetical protein